MISLRFNYITSPGYNINKLLVLYGNKKVNMHHQQASLTRNV